MGAWIETWNTLPTNALQGVAPCMGAWIETSLVNAFNNNLSKSHPVWVRGLKHKETFFAIFGQGVAPCMGAWIETNGLNRKISGMSRRTLYGCVD